MLCVGVDRGSSKMHGQKHGQMHGKMSKSRRDVVLDYGGSEGICSMTKCGLFRYHGGRSGLMRLFFCGKLNGREIGLFYIIYW